MNRGDEIATIAVVLESFQSYRLPRALDLKAKVDGGACLDDFDVQFLDWVLLERETILQLVRRHPEFEDIYVREYILYKEIVCRSIQNEMTAAKPDTP